MGKGTKIAYCDDTVNPVVGCAGCELLTDKVQYCYAYKLVSRYAGLKGWPADFFEPQYFPGRLEQSIIWKQLDGTDRPNKPWLNGYPRIIFLGDLADIFAENAPDPIEWLAPMIDDMSWRHIWLLLTKRPNRLVKFAKQIGGFPSNFWLGTTITRQAAILRAEAMQDLRVVSPDSKIWFSLEPQLGLVDLMDFDTDWVVQGCMSGKNPVDFDSDWARFTREWCAIRRIPYFLKQMFVGVNLTSTPLLDNEMWTQVPHV